MSLLRPQKRDVQSPKGLEMKSGQPVLCCLTRVNSERHRPDLGTGKTRQWKFANFECNLGIGWRLVGVMIQVNIYISLDRMRP